MKKFTKEENEIRKEVFDYNRNRRSWDISCVKKFGKRKVVLRAIEESEKRISNNQPNPSEFDTFKLHVSARAYKLAACLPSSGYTMGETRCIESRVLGGVVAVFDMCKEYAGCHNYVARHGNVVVDLPIRLLCHAENLMGLITIRTEQVQDRIWKCQWVVFDYTRTSRGIINSEVKYHLVNGYVVRYEEGRVKYSGYSGWDLAGRNIGAGWYHTTTLAHARKSLAEYLRYEKFYAKFKKWEEGADKRREKADKAAARAKEKEERQLAKSVDVVKKSNELKDALSHMYVYQDSINAGNCIPGTDAFLSANNLQKTDTRNGEFLLRISRSSRQYTNVVRIIVKYIADNYPVFYQEYNKAFRLTFNSL